MSGQIGVPSILGGSQNLGDPPLRNSFCCCYEKEWLANYCHTDNTRLAQSIKQQTNVAEAHWSFLDVLIVSSPLCVVKSNMAARMWICFVRNFFYMSLKQQNLFKIQSKWSEFFKSISYTLGRIKILMIHFLNFVCIKMRDFCVNAISVKWVEFRENVWGGCSFQNDRIFFLPTDRLYKGRLLTELPTFEELSNPMKFSFKFARNSRSGGRHLGKLLAAWWRVCDVNALNHSLAESLNHS